MIRSHSFTHGYLPLCLTAALLSGLGCGPELHDVLDEEVGVATQAATNCSSILGVRICQTTSPPSIDIRDDDSSRYVRVTLNKDFSTGDASSPGDVSVTVAVRRTTSNSWSSSSFWYSSPMRMHASDSPNADGFLLVDYFNIDVRPGGGSDDSAGHIMATVTGGGSTAHNVRQSPVYRQRGKDQIAYATWADGGDGTDSITGSFMSDHLKGGKGSDGIDGGDGNDRILGQGGCDRLWGGNGNDDIDGGDHRDDRCYAGNGNDKCRSCSRTDCER